VEAVKQYIESITPKSDLLDDDLNPNSSAEAGGNAPPSSNPNPTPPGSMDGTTSEEREAKVLCLFFLSTHFFFCTVFMIVCL